MGEHAEHKERYFEWNIEKELMNIEKHGVDFQTAKRAFFDVNRVIIEDDKHSTDEQRYFCLGRIPSIRKILTLRFTYREERIRIFGAAYWREGRKRYKEWNP